MLKVKQFLAPFQSLFMVGVFMVSTAQAEINYQDLKGVHDLISPQVAHLSPIYGLTLLGTNTLKNMRFYGNYGPKKPGLGCLERASRIHQLLTENQDCPQDFTSELLQRLFPAQDGINFVANQIDSDPISHLKPELIGKLLGRIAQVQDSELEDGLKTRGITDDLKNILSEALNPLSHFERLQGALKKQLRERGRTPEEKAHLEVEMTTVREALKKIHLSSSAAPELKQAGPGKAPKTKGVGKEKDFDEIAHLFVESLKESRIPLYLYPKWLPEQILLAYFWKKGNDKQDFIRLFQGMPELLKTPAFLKDAESQSQFLKLKYARRDFDLATVTGDSKLIAKNLLEHPELLVFYAQTDVFETKLLPPILSYAQARHSSLGDGTYSDCGGTSLRNFLDILLFNKKEGKFDVQYLRELQERNPELQIHPRLFSFYQAHFDPAASVSQEVRNEWSETISSGLPGVIYNSPPNNPQCNISSSGGGIDNMLAVLHRLLFRGATQGEKDDRPFPQASDRAGKLDILCSALSREGFYLSWSLAIGPSAKINERKFADILFSINGVRRFIWQFKPGHFAIQELQQAQGSWRDRVAEELAAQLTAPDSRASYLLLHWFIKEETWDPISGVMRSLIPADAKGFRAVQAGLFFALFLESNEGKLFALEKIIKGRLAALYVTAKRIQTKLPPLDFLTQRRISALLADSDYPLGDPLHAIGDSQIRYTRVIEPLIIAKLGKSWKDQQTGLIWGDTVKDASGNVLSTNQQTSDAYCKSIGARLPKKEEFQKLAQDFGFRSTGYIPQFLPNLYGSSYPHFYFWSSTANSSYGQEGVIFPGGTGIVSHLDRQTRCAVRCVLSSN